MTELTARRKIEGGNVQGCVVHGLMYEGGKSEQRGSARAERRVLWRQALRAIPLATSVLLQHHVTGQDKYSR